ncbi:hypothetical protein QYF36_000808 [Acer negundo]|nr:hypothetical protein QYF36_000808 [Acer negundo]
MFVTLYVLPWLGYLFSGTHWPSQTLDSSSFEPYYDDLRATKNQINNNSWEPLSPSGVSSGSSPTPLGPDVQQTSKEQRGTMAVLLPHVDITPIVSMDELPETKVRWESKLLKQCSESLFTPLETGKQAIYAVVVGRSELDLLHHRMSHELLVELRVIDGHLLAEWREPPNNSLFFSFYLFLLTSFLTVLAKGKEACLKIDNRSGNIDTSSTCEGFIQQGMMRGAKWERRYTIGQAPQLVYVADLREISGDLVTLQASLRLDRGGYSSKQGTSNEAP